MRFKNTQTFKQLSKLSESLVTQLCKIAIISKYYYVVLNKCIKFTAIKLIQSSTSDVNLARALTVTSHPISKMNVKLVHFRSMKTQFSLIYLLGRVPVMFVQMEA